MGVFVLEGETLWKVEGEDRQYIGEITDCDMDALGELVDIANRAGRKSYWRAVGHFGRVTVVAVGYMRGGFARATRELVEYGNAGTEVILGCTRDKHQRDCRDIDELLRRCFDVEQQLKREDDE